MKRKHYSEYGPLVLLIGGLLMAASFMVALPKYNTQTKKLGRGASSAAILLAAGLFTAGSVAMGAGVFMASRGPNGSPQWEKSSGE